jgi:choline dehydrogenase-like flavoprotein
VCSATVTSIVTDEAGRVSAIRLQSPAGGVRLARATHYVVACGGIESARLLLLSRGPRFPRGLGNDTDMVGRYFTEHVTSVRAYGNVGGLWDPRSRHERAVSDDYYVEAKQAGFGGLRLTFVSTRAAIDPQWRHPWESLERGVRALRVLELRLSIDQEMEPVADNQVALDNGVRDLFGNPGAALSLRATERDRATARHAEQLIAGLMRELGAEDVRLTTSVVGWNHHHMGTCRMGDDPRTSVVDRDLRVHACENLYVAGSAPFVTTGASNPTLTIVALSLRLADHLAERLRPGALPANSHDLSLRHPGESRDPGRTPPGSRLSPG